MTDIKNSRENVWSVPNIITMLRIAGVPLLAFIMVGPIPDSVEVFGIIVYREAFSAFCFAVLAVSDFIDGHLARTQNLVSDFGKFADPLADKILVAASLLALIELGSLPMWVALVILAREFIVSGLRMIVASKGIVVAASNLGKLKTISQCLAILCFIVKDSPYFVNSEIFVHDAFQFLSWALMLLCVALTVISMCDYFAKCAWVLGFGSRSAQHKSSCEVAAESKINDVGNEIISTDSRLKDLNDNISASAHLVIGKASEMGLKIAAAESCTGGLVCAALTAIPGSSAAVQGGVVSYSNAVKASVLGVSETSLEKFGAVSYEVACEMAHGLQERMCLDAAVSITGIAGPGGAVPGKPVGTVWIGCATKESCDAKLFNFEGDRSLVQRQSVLAALGILEECL